MAIENQGIRNVFNYYGPRKTDSHFGGYIDHEVIKTIQWTFDYTMIGTTPGVSVIGTLNKLDYSIPANASILTSRLQIITAFTSTSTTTTLSVGLEQQDRTAINATGLITATHGSAANIQVVGSIIDGSTGTAAAFINKTIGTAAGELVVTASAADLLTGKARMIVQYIEQGL